MRIDSYYLSLTALFYTACLFKPRAGMILFYGRTCQITKSLFSLEFYGAFYKGLTTKYYNLSWCNFNRERVYWPKAFLSITREPDFPQHLCIPLVVLYHHTQYYLKRSIGSWDIQIRKIEQSNWPRAFRSVTREPDFSQTCSFKRMIENHNMFNFRTFRTNISWLNFLLKCKNPIFGPFLALFAKNCQNKNFPEKSGSFTF